MMSGYFAMGVEGSSKENNAGNLIRSTHSFGGSFFFFIKPAVDLKAVRHSDTSQAVTSMPLYNFPTANDLILPNKCALVGVELTEDAVDLPSFRHPKAAAYVLGPEKGNLSDEMQERCDFIVKIPMKFCVNVGVAGAIIMYDRLVSRGRFPDRPVMPGGPTAEEMAKFSVS